MRELAIEVMKRKLEIQEKQEDLKQLIAGALPLIFERAPWAVRIDWNSIAYRYGIEDSKGKTRR